MNCMKCGREVESDQVFCKDCLTDMEKHPVDPNAVVLIPKRTAPVKKIHQRRQSPEDIILKLEKRCRVLGVALTLALLMLMGLGVGTAILAKELDVMKLIGQNYLTVEEETEPPVSEDTP